MKLITFPKSEWDDVKFRLDRGKIVYTVRVGNEYGRFRADDFAKTEWGSEVKIISVKPIKGGIKELKKEYEYFTKLTIRQIKELSRYNEMEIIALLRKT